MKRLFIATLLALTTFTAWAQQPVLATQGDTINYYIGLINGLQMGQMIQGQKEIMPGIPSQYDIVKQGFINGLNGDSTLSIDDLSAYLQTTFEALQARQAEEAFAREKEFLAKNGKRKGVVTTASGLQYEVLKKVKDKKAPRPAPTDTVKVHYEGKLLDGTVFDVRTSAANLSSSRSRVLSRAGRKVCNSCLLAASTASISPTRWLMANVAWVSLSRPTRH